MVQGNLIGTDFSGGADLGNAGGGIRILLGTDNTIGGTADEQRNIISGNGGHGVQIIASSGVTNNLIQGNFIGPDVTGTTALGNLGDGVLIFDAAGNTIGGTAPGARNVISGNSGHGVEISAIHSAAGNVIQGNLIGTDVSGVTALGNNGDGVSITLFVADTIIGGTPTGSGNTVAFNGGDGVSTQSLSGTGNSINLNSMFLNTGIGIDLADDGATANDPGDGDAGANNLQNFPDMASAEIDLNGDLVVEYSLDSAPGNSTYPLFIELFIADGGGEEGKTFIANDIYAVTDAQNPKTVNLGNAAGLGMSVGDMIVATATDDGGNTSEFSQPPTSVEGEVTSLVHNFSATLSGAQEVPPVSTMTTGFATFEFSSDFSQLSFQLTVKDGVGITQAHIHCGGRGEVGPIIAFLAGEITSGVNVHGVWISNVTLTDANVMPGNGCGDTINELGDALNDSGEVYVNVHSVANPSGEIRGQLQVSVGR